MKLSKKKFWNAIKNWISNLRSNRKHSRRWANWNAKLICWGKASYQPLITRVSSKLSNNRSWHSLWRDYLKRLGLRNTCTQQFHRRIISSQVCCGKQVINKNYLKLRRWGSPWSKAIFLRTWFRTTTMTMRSHFT